MISRRGWSNQTFVPTDLSTELLLLPPPPRYHPLVATAVLLFQTRLLHHLPSYRANIPDDGLLAATLQLYLDYWRVGSLPRLLAIFALYFSRPHPTCAFPARSLDPTATAIIVSTVKSPPYHTPPLNEQSFATAPPLTVASTPKTPRPRPNVRL
ncbi:hypothetical protein ASPBRDRAFT_494633 [Aspergillus brasiliensis CBS 101740]|uniref:Uncharacterized protein n=1 Tax=Aspergillus brasiliensis (strain CBS 101740 / IMI 381727 / IBT 21946) TaxID=767769 RepID=A0A1L9UNQ8_ASPBC|nr:hypothetical protein ASPBRDRAFT_494633 [Aspergillus brasiliensis CBS 101740]